MVGINELGNSPAFAVLPGHWLRRITRALARMHPRFSRPQGQDVGTIQTGPIAYTGITYRTCSGVPGGFLRPGKQARGAGATMAPALRGRPPSAALPAPPAPAQRGARSAAEGAVPPRPGPPRLKAARSGRGAKPNRRQGSPRAALRAAIRCAIAGSVRSRRGGIDPSRGPPPGGAWGVAEPVAFLLDGKPSSSRESFLETAEAML